MIATTNVTIKVTLVNYNIDHCCDNVALIVTNSSFISMMSFTFRDGGQDVDDANNPHAC